LKVTKAIRKGLLEILKLLLFLVSITILFILSGVLINSIQSSLFIPDDFIIWTVGESVPPLMFIPFIFVLIYLLNIKKLHAKTNNSMSTANFGLRYKKGFIAILLVIIIGYYILTNVSVISNDKIVAYSFFSPRGKEYSYSDIKSLYTGAYNATIPFVRSKGEFYYILELKDGKKINLVNIGGTKDNNDSYLTIMELDQAFVELDVPKIVDAKHINMYLKGLDKVYRDRINSIIKNVK